MTERLIFGRLDDVQELVIPDAEPISVAEVKSSLGIAFTAHDVEIERLITSCRRAAEEVLNVSLTGKLVSVLWEMFYDSLPLPYMPLADVPLLTVTDLDNVAIDSASYDVYSVGSNSLFKGDFPNGVKLTYTTKALVDIKINEKLIDAVGSCLEQDMTSAEAIRKHFR
jgi:hypothetical protein